MANSGPTASQAIDRELAARALQKRSRGERPSRDELSALRRVEKQQEEKRRWEYYASIPAKHWKQMSGRQAKVIIEQAQRYGIPFDGREVDLTKVVPALHDFLAQNAAKLNKPRDADQVDDQLDRLRRAKADMAELERDTARGALVDVEQHRMTVEAIARAFRVEADGIADGAAETLFVTAQNAGFEPEEPGEFMKAIKDAIAEEVAEFLRRAAAQMARLIE